MGDIVVVTRNGNVITEESFLFELRERGLEVVYFVPDVNRPSWCDYNALLDNETEVVLIVGLEADFSAKLALKAMNVGKPVVVISYGFDRQILSANSRWGASLTCSYKMHFYCLDCVIRAVTLALSKDYGLHNMKGEIIETKSLCKV